MLLSTVNERRVPYLLDIMMIRAHPLQGLRSKARSRGAWGFLGSLFTGWGLGLMVQRLEFRVDGPKVGV